LQGPLAYLLVTTFAVWTACEGGLWMLAPGVMGASVNSVAHGNGELAAVMRASVDVPLGYIAWSIRRRLGEAPGVIVLAGIFAANLVLSVSGFLAQINALATPSRWPLEILHIVWTVFAGVLLVRYGRGQRAS
jgi:hypothetical protein